MHFRPGEVVLGIFHHHPFPYFLRVLKVILYTVPLYILLFLFQNGITTAQFVISAIVITFVSLSVLLYDGLIFWLDRVIVTNFRVVHIDWKFFSLVQEFEAELDDIQDIKTRETGFFSLLKIFDYGDFKLETAASRVTIFFTDAPDPEGMKHFIFEASNP